MSRFLNVLRFIILSLLLATIVGLLGYQIYQLVTREKINCNKIVKEKLAVAGANEKLAVAGENVFIHKTITLTTNNVFNAIAISPQDGTIVSGSNDSEIKLWNVDGDTLGTLKQKGSIVAISLDRGILASGETNTGKIYIWDLPSQRLLKTIPFNVTALALRCEVETLASGSSQGKIKIWNLETGTLKYNPLPGHADSVTFLAISPDGKLLASGSENGEIKIWDLGAGGLKYNLLPKHDNKVTSLAISPDGQKLVSSSRDGKIKIWNLGTGTLLHGLIGSENEVTSVAISPDGQTFASGSTDGKIKVWDLNTAALLRIYNLSGYGGEFITLAIDSNRQIVVSGHVLDTIKIWLVQQELPDG